MGEFARRKDDNVSVKIGTCEEMYYLRFEDRHNVTPEPNSADPVAECGLLRFRLPFPDEDGTPIGEYKDYSRGLRLCRKGTFGCEDWKDDAAADDPGTVQLRHECGLLVNVACHHGLRLPDVGKSSAFWNGKTHSFELASLRPVGSGLLVYPVVRCRHCGQAWRYEWADVWDFIPREMQARLRVYRDAFVEERAEATS